MPEAGDQPAKPLRTWRPMALGSAVVLLVPLLALAGVAAMALRDCHKALSGSLVYDGLFKSPWGTSSDEYRCFLIPTLGWHDGVLAERMLKELLARDEFLNSKPSAIAWRLRIYLLLPENLAPKRPEAAFALSKCGKLGILPLTRLLSESDAQTRRVAAWSLGQIGSEAAVAIPQLERLSNDPDDLTRRAVREALKKIRGEEAGK